MKAPNEIIQVWRKFDGFPMETLTKVWHHRRSGRKKQRSLSEMKEHRDQYGISGNCFDLSIWLLDEFDRAGIEAYPIGLDHGAVIARDQNRRRFLCDLGDQWLMPILIDTDDEQFTNARLKEFFPGAEISAEPAGDGVKVTYHRPNGKYSSQIYQTAPLDRKEFLAAAEHSQNTIHPKPLVETRVQLPGETAHWEFYDWRSFLSTNSGLVHDRDADSLEEWADRICAKTGYDEAFVTEALSIYEKMTGEL